MRETRSNPQASVPQPEVVIDAESMNRLEALADGAFRRTPDLADRLLEELGRARVVSPSELPSNVVAIGRAVTYRDESTSQEKTIVPVFPEEADIERDRISILTPIGVALIGLTEGASFPWDTRDGERRLLTVLRVAELDAADGLKA